MKIEKIGVILDIIAGIIFLGTPFLPAVVLYIYNVSGYFFYWMFGLYYLDVYIPEHEELSYTSLGFILDPTGIVTTIILITTGCLALFFVYRYIKGKINNKTNGKILLFITIIAIFSMIVWMLMWRIQFAMITVEQFGVSVYLSFWDIFNNSPAVFCGMAGAIIMIIGAMISYMSSYEIFPRKKKVKVPKEKKKIKFLKKKIRRKKKEKIILLKKCPFCGEEIETGDKYCINCGKDVRIKICPNCGKILKKRAKFCSECGYVIE